MKPLFMSSLRHCIICHKTLISSRPVKVEDVAYQDEVVAVLKKCLQTQDVSEVHLYTMFIISDSFWQVVYFSFLLLLLYCCCYSYWTCLLKRL